jgi:hypothetical protein
LPVGHKFLQQVAKKNGFPHEREGLEFHSRRKCANISGGFQPLGDRCAKKALFQ